MSDDDQKRSIIVPGDTSLEAERVKHASAIFKRMIEEQRPTGVGYIVITFESPLSLKKPQVALASDHDLATIERICAGILNRDKPRIIA